MADARAATAQERAVSAGQRLSAVLAVSDPKVIEDAKETAPRAFDDWTV
jgi:hypothetical protein